ncbi:SDR family oxidoreductase [Bradyrhizobium sp. KB893862 SZCCT0404]|uniref:SDR family oxidoreductase n=1 Tax=Bradyrhizobium sp. KB893862 SZCCT0404 TaxID=2807672 RepID=UPI001BA8EA24|nr:SDR family oxidoreductase [Bradyrhizobium sp. KB893862 SZCCT0404]MBR1175303.1 SDR family oxidoreductase [Bradyrhizobium sp. KB893862 SZCCT0404]
MDLGIRGRKAIVAGGSAGLGKSSALALAREGVELVISARGEERLIEAAAEIQEKTKTPVKWVVADHGTADGRARLLAACPEPDILVITCSPPKFTPDFREISVDDWQQALATGMIGPIELMKGVIDGMRSRKWGRIVNVMTLAARAPVDFRLLSGPPRSGLANYTVAMAKPLAKDNVIINNILPGMHHTGGIRERFQSDKPGATDSYETEVQQIIDRLRIPAGRFGEADDVGAFCAMFCSEFANYTIGQSLIIDGGVHHSLF